MLAKDFPIKTAMFGAAITPDFEPNTKQYCIIELMVVPHKLRDTLHNSLDSIQIRAHFGIVQP
jgi:hypothetical protein